MSNNAFIRFTDCLGHKPVFFINRNERDASYIGTCCTILVGIGMFSVVLYYMIEFILGSELRIVSSQDNLNEPITFDLTRKLFMIRLMDSKGSEVDPRVASLHAALFSYKELNSTTTKISLSKCSESLHDEEHQSMIQNLSSHLCLDHDVNSTLHYDENKNTGSFLTIFVARCTNNSESSNCFPKETIDQELNAQSYYLTYTIANTKVDHFNYSSPFIPTYFSTFVKIMTSSNYDYTMYYKYTEYRSDQGWLFTSWKNFSGFQFDESLTEKVTHTNSQEYFIPNTFGTFVFWVSYSMINKYERTYPKIQSVIVNISALAKVILVIGEVLVSLFSSGSYYASLIFAVNSKVEKNKQIIHLPVDLKNTQSKLFHEKERINPCIACQWKIFPKLTKKTRDIELYKIKVSEYLSVENIIHKLFAVEIRAQMLPEKKSETVNTSHSIIQFQYFPSNLIRAAGTQNNQVKPLECIKIHQ